MSDFQLCNPEFVAGCLAHSKASTRCVVLEAHFTSLDHPLDPDQPGRHHLPGAIQVHPSYLEAGTRAEKYYPFYENPTDGNLLPHHELVVALERLGITSDTVVIVYGTEPDGPMAAARVVWGLIYAGVKKVRLLDGGIAAWLEFEGASVPSIEQASEIGKGDDRVADRKSAWIARSEVLATMKEVRAASRHPHTAMGKLVDVRRVGEWDGTCTDSYIFFSDAGHIPNSCFQGDWEVLLDVKSHKIGSKLAEVAQYWRDLGIIDAAVEAGQKELIFYCGTGWRSSVSFLVAQLLGLRAKNFDDGFYGWSFSGENQIAYGQVPSGKDRSSISVDSQIQI